MFELNRMDRGLCAGILGLVTAFLLLAGAGVQARSVPFEKAPQVLRELPVTAEDERSAFANNSPLLAADPGDSRVVVMASRLDNPDFGCALHVSGDGGRTWLPAPVVEELPKGAEKCYGPEVAFDRQGKLKYLFIGLAGRGNTPTGAFLVTSTNQGYSPPRRVLGPERYMVRMAIDRTIKPNGRIHLVWLEAGADSPLGGLPQADNPIMAAHSDDGGATFSEPIRVSDPGRTRVVAPALALGPNHSVHVAYYDLKDDSRDYQGLEGPAWEGNWTLVVSNSTDGGLSFGRGAVVDQDLVPPERVMLIYTMPPPSLVADPAGRLFAAWPDARNGDWDVFLRRSIDGGRSWEKVRRLNDDPVGSGSNQYMPRISSAPDGRLDAIFYDRRDDPRNVRNNVYFSSSNDHGDSFTKNKRVTTDSSDSMVGPRYPIPSAKGLVEYGARIALLSQEEAALASWTDTRNSSPDTYQQDIFATKIGLVARERSQKSRLAAPSPLVVVGALAFAELAIALFVFRRRRSPAGLGGK